MPRTLRAATCLLAGLVSCSKQPPAAATTAAEPTKPAPRPGSSQQTHESVRTATEPGFRDVVRSPDAWRSMQALYGDVLRNRERAKRWPDELVAAAVHRLVFGIAHSQDDDEDLSGCLYQIQERAAAATRELLRRCDNAPELFVARQAKTTQDSLYEAPVERACDLLSNAPVGSLALVRPWLTNERAAVRKHAALVTAAIGTAPAARAVAPLLSDPDDFVRSYVMIGIQRALRQQRLTTEARGILFEPMLERIGDFYCRDAARLLVGWDADAAERGFRQHGHLRTESDGFPYAIAALATCDRLLPADQLLRWWQGSWPEDSDEAKGAVLTMLARHHRGQDQQLFRQQMEQPGELAAHAAEALTISLGVGDWGEHLGNQRWFRPTIERRLDALWYLEAEVCNGGLSQYFLNSTGSGWKHAIAALEELGDEHRLGVLRDAVAKFPREPSTDRGRRIEQLAEVERTDEDAFETLDNRYYDKARVDIEVLCTRYLLLHLDEFRKLWRK